MKTVRRLGTFLFALALVLQPAGATPEISVDATLELDLSGDPQAFTIDIANSGLSGNLNVTSASFGDDPNFEVGTLPDPIIPGDSDIIGFVFNPLGQTGLFSTTLTIESDDPAQPTTLVAISGVIHDPMFSAVTEVHLTAAGSYVIDATNMGATQPLEFNFIGVSLSGEDATAFSKGISWPFSGIPPGESGEITFSFDPGERVGTFTAQLRINTNDPIISPFIIEVRAEIAEEKPFWITNIQLSDDGESLTLTWNSVAETDYAIDRSTDLKQAWVQIEGAQPSTGSVTTFTDTDIPDDAGRVFYRVRLAEP